VAVESIEAQEKVYAWTHTRLSTIFVGIVCAFYMNQKEEKRKTTETARISSFFTDLLVLFSFFALFSYLPFLGYLRIDERWTHSLSHAFYAPFLGVIIVLMCEKRGMVSRVLSFVFSSRLLVYLHPLSYSIYILHTPVAIAVTLFMYKPEDLTSPSYLTVFILSLFTYIITIFVALFIYNVIERPVLKFSQKFIYSKSGKVNAKKEN